MPQQEGLNRRWFLKNAGLRALAAGRPVRVRRSPPPRSRRPLAALAQGASGKYDFDTIYNRFGTDSMKFDQQIRVYGKDSVEVGMGIADIDFKAAPSITKAMQERLQHENWGYLDMAARRSPRPSSPGTSATTASTIEPGRDGASRRASTPGSLPPSRRSRPRAPRCCCRRRPTTASTATSPPPRRSPRKCRSSSSTASSRWTSRSSRAESASTPTRSSCATRRTRPATAGAPEDLLRIGEICLKHRVIVLADEIHCDWVTKGQKYTPFASLPNKAVVDNSITFKAASKSFGLAAHKIAWFYSTNPDYMARDQGQPPRRAQHARHRRQQGALYADGEEWLKQASSTSTATTSSRGLHQARTSRW